MNFLKLTMLQLNKAILLMKRDRLLKKKKKLEDKIDKLVESWGKMNDY